MSDGESNVLCPPSASQPKLLQRITAEHLAIIDLVLAGATQREVARVTGRNEASLSQLLRQPLVQDELVRRRAEQQRQVDTAVASVIGGAAQILKDNEGRAAMTMVELLGSGDEKMKFSSAKDILDRAYGQGASSQPTVTVLNAETVQILVQTLRQDRELDAA